MNDPYELVIVGGGPAGAAAAIYAARKRLKTLFITNEWGGQSTVSTDIQNWIGTPSISGADLAKNLKAHVEAQANDCLTTLSPALATAHEAQGYLFQIADLNWRGAEDEFRRAGELAPNNGAAKFFLGTQLATFGKVEAAIELTRQALVTEPLSSDSYYYLSNYFSSLNRLDEAERAIRRAIECRRIGHCCHGDVWRSLEVSSSATQGA